MIVYVLEFKGTRIEFFTEAEALQYKKDNGIKADVIQVEKNTEPEINVNELKWSIEQQAEMLFDAALEENWYSRFDVQFYANKGEAKAISLMQYYDNLWKLIQQNFKNGNYDFKLPEYIDNTINKP